MVFTFAQYLVFLPHIAYQTLLVIVCVNAIRTRFLLYFVFYIITRSVDVLMMGGECFSLSVTDYLRILLNT